MELVLFFFASFHWIFVFFVCFFLGGGDFFSVFPFPSLVSSRPFLRVRLEFHRLPPSALVNAPSSNGRPRY